MKEIDKDRQNFIDWERERNTFKYSQNLFSNILHRLPREQKDKIVGELSTFLTKLRSEKDVINFFASRSIDVTEKDINLFRASYEQFLTTESDPALEKKLKIQLGLTPEEPTKPN